jgi:glutathione S-transferase
MFMSDLTLYLAPGTCAMAVRIASPKPVPLTGSSNRIWRLASSAPRYLPSIPRPSAGAGDGARRAHRNPALLLYVAQRFPDAGLALDDPFLLARMQEVHGFLASTVHVAHAHGRRAARWADDPQAIAAMQAKVPHNMRDGFAEIERHYLAGPWVLGSVQPGRHLPVRGGELARERRGGHRDFPRWRPTHGACWHARSTTGLPFILLRCQCSSGTHFPLFCPALRSFSHFCHLLWIKTA